MQTQPTLLDKLDRVPPFVVMFTAKEGRRALNMSDISRRSGIPTRTLFRLRSLISWATVDIATVQMVSAACGYDLMHMSACKRRMAIMMTRHNPPLPHLSDHQRAMFVAKMKQYIASRRKERTTAAA